MADTGLPRVPSAPQEVQRHAAPHTVSTPYAEVEYPQRQKYDELVDEIGDILDLLKVDALRDHDFYRHADWGTV